MWRLWRGKQPSRELELDEIFLDASNLPSYNTAQLEGRLERPIAERTYQGLFLLVGLFIVVFLGQALRLQIVEGHLYAAWSEDNRLRPEVLFAPRGVITDRNGTVLVGNGDERDGYATRTYRTPGFAHLLGYVSYPKKDRAGNYYETELSGIAGVEASFDEVLQGENGVLLVEENAQGTVESRGKVVPPRAGETLALSIDARVQEAFGSVIAELAERIPYEGGSAVLMDVSTGEIHALVSYPEYDPNILSSGKPAEVISAYQQDFREPYLDRAVSGLYTPGSIVKPLIAAGALTDGIITPETVIVSTGALTVPNPYDPDRPTVFRDWKAHGATDLRHAIAVSSDVYFYTVGGGFEGQQGLGIERLAYWYRLFGLEDPTGIELSGEASGFIPTPAWKETREPDDPWRIGNTYHTAIGQYAMQISPLEAVRAIAAIANGGKLIQPSLRQGGSGTGESLAVSQEALAVVREGMRLGVTEGTSIGLNAYSYAEVAAKTGTAELGLNNEYRNSWLVGFFPYEKPKYAFAIVMERGPAGNGVGGVYVMSRVIETLRQTAPEYFE